LWSVCDLCETARVHACASTVSARGEAALHSAGLRSGTANRRNGTANINLPQRAQGHGRATVGGVESEMERHRLRELGCDDSAVKAFEASQTEAVFENCESAWPTSARFGQNIRRRNAAHVSAFSEELRACPKGRCKAPREPTSKCNQFPQFAQTRSEFMWIAWVSGFKMEKGDWQSV